MMNQETKIIIKKVNSENNNMAFSEKIKKLAKIKSHFHCCVCHKEFVEVHHIIPESAKGNNDIENAAPLCASCHDLYGGNPEKRKQIREMRDHWWEIVKEMENYAIQNNNIDALIFDEEDSKEKMNGKGIAIYHAVYENETFEQSASIIFKLVKKAQTDFPNQKRFLYLDIDGHKNNLGGYDNDMYELQKHFVIGFISKYISGAHVPLLSFKTKLQDNDMPDELKIIESGDTTHFPSTA